MLNFKLRTVYSICSEQGDSRAENQDSILARSGEIAGRTAGLFVVADGCGGLSYGGSVSRLLTDSFQVIWEEELPKLLYGGRNRQDTILSALRKWMDQINAAAYQFGRQVGEKVGSTATILLTLGRRYYILNVGDSRAYLYRRGVLRQLTEDQSLLADLLRNREITLEQADNFTRKNVLTMCVGGYEKVQCFCTYGKLRRKDIFLLCSDGLYRGLGEEHLGAYLPAEVEEESASRLRGHIAAGGASDNVSALLLEII